MKMQTVNSVVLWQIFLPGLQRRAGWNSSLEACPASMALRALKLGETDAISVVDGDYLWDERNHMNTTLRFLNTPWCNDYPG